MTLRPNFTVETLEARTLLAIVPSGFTDSAVAGSLNSPTAMSIAPDGRIFVAQQGGAIRVIKNGTLLGTPFFTFPNVIANEERGLVGVELDPNFQNNHFVYAYYTTSESVAHNRLVRLTANGDVAAGGSLVTLVDLPPIGSAIWHMGGAIHFGEDDKLYLGVGDHQQPSQAQNLDSVFGKLLRLNPDGSIPTDNPFYNQRTGLNRAIWAYGFRNPFTFGIQPGSGLIYINDVGQETWEEINEGEAGANYGWPGSEGPTSASGITAPTYYYNHNIGAYAITGGVFYNPSSVQFPTGYVGKYFFADLTGGWIKTLNPSNKAVANFATGVSAAVDLDIGPDGSLFYLQRTGSIPDGAVRRISSTSNPTQPPQIVTNPQSQTRFTGQSVTFSVSATGSGLSFQWQRNNSNIVGADESSYTIASVAEANEGNYRVSVSNSAGTVFSSAATLTVNTQSLPTATITSPVAGTLFRAGQTFTLTGTGNDAEDGALDGDAFTWQVDYHTGSVVRPFVPATSGQTSMNITIPTTTPYKLTNVFYRIMLTVTDSNGASVTRTRDLAPRTGTIKVTTNIGAIDVEIDEQPKRTPTAFEAVAGITRSLSAPEEVTVGGTDYVFYTWSDGGEREHEISAPVGPVTYVARYKPAFSVNDVMTLNPTADAYVAAGSPNTPFGAGTNLVAKFSTTARYRRDTYLKFDIRNINGTIQDAKLRLFGGLDSAVDQNIMFGVYHAPNAKWGESIITWNNRPSTATKALNTALVSNNTKRWYEVDLTAFLAAERQRGATIVTFVVRNLFSSSTNSIFNSRQAGSNRPELVVTV